MEPKERKKALRKQIALLKQQHANNLIELSEMVLAHLEAHPAFKEANTILLYHSLPDEVNTHSFIKKWSTKKQILLPVVVGNELEIRLYNPSEQLATGAFNILEPTGPTFNHYDEIDLIVVPGVAFSRQGHRLGRGKGYYDRLLPRIPHAFRIGICFPFQLIEEIPSEPFDMPMHTIISHKE